jgi:hypothetical protein
MSKRPKIGGIDMGGGENVFRSLTVMRRQQKALAPSDKLRAEAS